MKYFSYCRVSDEREDRQMLGLPSQKRELAELAQSKGLDVVRAFSERGSAYKPGRVQFNKMLDLIEAGKADAILVWHLSRLSRTSLDAGRIIYLMDIGKLKEIRTKDKVFVDSTNDKFVLQIEMAVNKKSSDDTSDYVKRDNKTKLKNGEYPGNVPTGYLNLNTNGVISGKRYDQKKQEMLIALGRPLKRIEIDPIVGPLVQRLLQMASTGSYSLRQLREAGYEMGIKGIFSGKMLVKSTVDNILRDPFYYGEFYYTGAMHVGIHEPLISKRTFEQIQEHLANGSRPKKKKYTYTFTQLVYCGECGGFYSGDVQKGIRYLRCAKAKYQGCSNRKHYQEDFVDVEVRRVIEEFQLPSHITQWLLGQLQTIYKEESKFKMSQQLELQSNEQQLRRRLEAYTEKWLSPHNAGGVLISDEEYREIKTSIHQEIQSIQEKLRDNVSEQDNWLERCTEFFDFARDIKKRYEVGCPEEKRSIVRTMGAKITLLNGQAKIEMEGPFNVFQRAKKLVRLSEPQKMAEVSHQYDFSSKMQEWLPRLDSNQ